jgi:hypothetical protein
MPKSHEPKRCCSVHRRFDDGIPNGMQHGRGQDNCDDRRRHDNPFIEPSNCSLEA